LLHKYWLQIAINPLNYPKLTQICFIMLKPFFKVCHIIASLKTTFVRYFRIVKSKIHQISIVVVGWFNLYFFWRGLSWWKVIEIKLSKLIVFLFPWSFLCKRSKVTKRIYFIFNFFLFLLFECLLILLAFFKAFKVLIINPECIVVNCVLYFWNSKNMTL